MPKSIAIYFPYQGQDSSSDDTQITANSYDMLVNGKLKAGKVTTRDGIVQMPSIGNGKDLFKQENGQGFIVRRETDVPGYRAVY